VSLSLQAGEGPGPVQEMVPYADTFVRDILNPPKPVPALGPDGQPIEPDAGAAAVSAPLANALGK